MPPSPNETRKVDADLCLYPPIEPYKTGYLAVGPHNIYWEACGNPNGKPVVILHGGPGAGCSPKQRRFHDPKQFCVILFDQRGCGRSTPDGCLEDNTTWHLVADIERLRTLFGFENWEVFGGSWGSTLALAYAVTHPTRVTKLVLRGIFLVKKAELDYIYHTATPLIFPEAYQPIIDWLPPEERHDLVSAYRKRIMSADADVALKAAKLWCQWEDSISQLYPDNDSPSHVPAPFEGSGGEQKIHLHYMWNRGFFEYDGWLLDQVEKIKDTPTVIIHGRYDVVCPPVAAFELGRKLPNATCSVIIIPDSGHSAWEPGTTSALVDACKPRSILSRTSHV